MMDAQKVGFFESFFLKLKKTGLSLRSEFTKTGTAMSSGNRQSRCQSSTPILNRAMVSG